jgi:hypothetical protein
MILAVGCFPLEDTTTYTAGAATNNPPDFSGVETPDSGAEPPLDVDNPVEGMDPMLPLVDPPRDPDAGMTPPASADAAVVPFTCEGPGEFEGVGGQGCYRASVATATWFDAQDDCQAWGGDLVVIESQAEDTFLTARMTVDVWIGAHDRAVEGTVVWVNGQPFVFENWGTAQPDDFQGQEDCLEKRFVEEGAWNDRPCGGDPQAYFCER